MKGAVLFQSPPSLEVEVGWQWQRSASQHQHHSILWRECVKQKTLAPNMRWCLGQFMVASSKAGSKTRGRKTHEPQHCLQLEIIKVVTFALQVRLPNAGLVRGMGVRKVHAAALHPECVSPLFRWCVADFGE